MTETTADLVAELATTLDAALRTVGDTRRSCLGFLVTPAQMVARMVSAITDDADREAMRQAVRDVGGMAGLVEAALAVETWMERSLGPTTMGRMPVTAVRRIHLFERFSMQKGRLCIDRLPMRRTVAHLSSEKAGLHEDEPDPTGNWRIRIVALLAPMLDGLPAITVDDIRLDGTGPRTGTRISGNHPLLADCWAVYGMGSLEHLPDILLEAAARRIALVMREVHDDLTHLSNKVTVGERMLREDLTAEMGDDTGAAIGVANTRIHLAHVSSQEGVLAVTHYNSTTDVTMPGHTLRPETVTVEAGIGDDMDFHDTNAHELNLRARGAAMRAGGLVVAPVLQRLMLRDGVDREAMLDAMDNGQAAIATAAMRRLGFGTDVSKVGARNGVVDCHFRLATGLTYRRGRIHATRTALPDSVRHALIGRPIESLVVHPIIQGAVVTGVGNARTGSLIVSFKMP